MSGWSVLGQGLLGAVGGAAQAAGKVAEDDRKAEIERLREERLSQLRMKEYVAKGDVDIANIPRKSAAEIPGKVAEQAALSPGLIDRAQKVSDIETSAIDTRYGNKKATDIAYSDQEAEAKAKETKLVEAAKLPFRLTEIGAQGANQIRVAEVMADEAAKRDWTAGADGKYYDAKGRMITTSVKIEGRMETIPVIAPKSKVEGKDANWADKENLDSINRQIEKAAADPMVDSKKMADLIRQKNAIMQRMGAPGALPAPANRPPLSSFQK